MSQNNNIKITPYVGVNSDPRIEFVGAGNSTITLRVLNTADGAIVFQGIKGELLSLVDADVSIGSSVPTFAVNDAVGIPLIQAYNNGNVILAPYGTQYVGIGTTTASQSSPYKVQLYGGVRIDDINTGSGKFNTNLSGSISTSPTGVLAPVITFPSTSTQRHIIHSISVANKARRQPTGAGATVGINTLAGAVTGIITGGVGTGYTAGDVFVSMATTDALNRIRGLISIATTSFVGVGTTGDPAFAGITSAIGIVTAVSGGAITGVAITFGGFGYTSPPVITFQSPVGGGTTETGTAVVTYGEVTGVFLNTPGEGYTTPPSVSIASTTGIGASITADVDSDGRVIRLNLLSRGYGYSKLNALGNNEENEVYISLPGLARTEVAVDVAIDRVPVGGGTTVQTYLAFSTPIPPGGVVEILKQPLVLNPSDQIEMRGLDVNGSGLSNAIDVSISYESVNSTAYIGYGTATGANAGLGTAIRNIGLVTATTNPIMIQSIRLTNTEFVGDYDVSIEIYRANNRTYTASVNSTVSAGSSIIFVDNLTNNSLETVVRAGNLVSVAGTSITNAPIVSVGNTFVVVGVGSTTPSAINVGTAVTFTVDSITYLARNLIIPAFASVELCDMPKRIEPGFSILLDAETVGIDTNLTQTIDVQVSGKTII